MRYYLIRDNVIENLVKWDGETPFNPGPNTKLIPEEELPDGLKIGDRIEPEGEEPDEDLDDEDDDDAIDFGDEEDEEDEAESETEES